MRLIFLALLFIYILPGCKKFIEVDTPPTSITSGAVFEKESTATSAVLSIYSRTMNTSTFLSGGFNGLGYYGGLLSDELVSHANSAAVNEMYSNNLTPSSGNTTMIWEQCYRYIYDANSIIEGLVSSTTLSPSIKKQLTAEARFIRAWCYLHLTNFYGEVPLLLTTSYVENSIGQRQSSSAIYAQIIADLLVAQAELSPGYISSTNTASTERTRPNQFAATALLARAYLYSSDYIKAESEASKVIANTQDYDTVALENVFLRNSKETIWSLQPVVNGTNTFDALAFVLTTAPAPASITGRNTAISQQLAAAFEPGDRRASTWIGIFTIGGNTYRFPYKYRVYLSGQPLSEYFNVLRLGEMYLIRAEARIQQGKISDGVADLNVLRKRARALPTGAISVPLPDLPLMSKEQALLAVEHERQIELFCEGAHRWYDLKRTGRADAILKPIKGNNWQTTDQLWPVPGNEIGLNPNLQPQNPGYN